MQPLVVPRGSIDYEDPWAIPAVCRPIELRSAIDGSSPRLPTRCALYHDGARFYAVFHAVDDHVTATHLEHDAPLWEEDVVELFLAPGGPANYFELEVNPLATTFDARVDSPSGERSSMVVDTGWTCSGLWAATRRAISGGSAERWDTVLSFPFTALMPEPPSPGALWRGNLYRIDRSPAGDEYSAWMATGRNPADFHLPACFGEIVLE
ncbi:MAG TPA: carbohydrate-binding family 9-like protein [Thermoanaerobaculia bacterium]|nr:carbohydrate-binding family 9-like protein [Thermoanaerobaculia bacterium]